MSAEQDNAAPEPIQIPSTHALRRIGIIGLCLVAVIVAIGLWIRFNNAQQLATWTSDQATPTVTLAALDFDGAGGNLTLPGSIQPYQKAPIYARVAGYLKSWHEDIGAKVTAGQVLGVIDSPELDQQFDQAKADLASADANDRLAALTAKRWRGLVASQSVAEQAADEKTGDAAAKKALREAAAANVRRLQALEGFKTIVSPFDGVVTVRNTDVGALINAGGATGQPLFEVSDLRKVRIYVQVPQAFAAQPRPGLQATFEMPQYPGRIFKATLVTTSNAMSATSASMTAELQADNADGALQAGSYCQVRFALPANGKVTTLPATALAASNRGAQVAVVGPDNKVTFKTVQLGRDFGDSVEVLAGLSPNDQVIDNPPETLLSGEIVTVAPPPANPSASASAKRS